MPWSLYKSWSKSLLHIWVISWFDSYLNNYFNLHVCLSIRFRSVRSSVCLKTNSSFCSQITRLAQNFKCGKFKSATAFSYSLIKRNAEKCKNYQNRTMFRYAPSCSKFYYITHLCEMGLHRKFVFFYIFQIKTILFFFKSRFYIKSALFCGIFCY